VLYEDQVEDQTAVATTNLNAVLSEHIVLNAGASFKKLQSHNFQQLVDLAVLTLMILMPFTAAINRSQI
jgi:microcompartment protein CcmK/EutM